MGISDPRNYYYTKTKGLFTTNPFSTSYKPMDAPQNRIMRPHATEVHNPSKLMILLICRPDREFKYDFGRLTPRYAFRTQIQQLEVLNRTLGIVRFLGFNLDRNCSNGTFLLHSKVFFQSVSYICLNKVFVLN